MVHWHMECGGAGKWQNTSLGRSLWARTRAPSPRPFHPHSGALPDRAAAAQGRFCHTPSVRRWPGASPQRGGRWVARSTVAAWRNHHVAIGGSYTARERRWNGLITPPRPLRRPHGRTPALANNFVPLRNLHSHRRLRIYIGTNQLNNLAGRELRKNPRKGSSFFGPLRKASMVGFISNLAPLLNYLRRRSPGPPFPPDHRQTGERGAIIHVPKEKARVLPPKAELSRRSSPNRSNN